MFKGPEEQQQRYAELSQRVMVHVDHIVGSPPETRPSAVNGLLRCLWELSADGEQREQEEPGRKAAKAEATDG